MGGFRFFLVITVVLLQVVACTGGYRSASLGPKALVLWPQAGGAYQFQEVDFLSLTDPRELASSRARIYWRAQWSGQGFSGSPVKPHWLRARELWIPQDVTSAIAVATFLIFERLYDFDRSLGIEGQLTWPRQVAVDEPVVSSRGALLDNAFYDQPTDSIVVTRVSTSALPIGLSHGVLAHEHFHAHFAAAFMQAQMKLKSASAGNLKIEGKNKFYLSAWNEGLADLYGALFSGQARFGSQVSDLDFHDRHLDGKLQSFETNAFEKGNVYLLGTILARWLYHWQTQLGGRDLTSKILSRLPGWLEEFTRQTSGETGNPAALHEGWLFLKILAGATAVERQAICPDVQRLMPNRGRDLCP